MLTLQGIADRIDLLAFSPDGRSLAALSDRGAQVWAALADGGAPQAVVGASSHRPACSPPRAATRAMSSSGTSTSEVATNLPWRSGVSRSRLGLRPRRAGP